MRQRLRANDLGGDIAIKQTQVLNKQQSSWHVDNHTMQDAWLGMFDCVYVMDHDSNIGQLF